MKLYLRIDFSFLESHLNLFRNLFRSITSTFSALPTRTCILLLSGICLFVSFLRRTYLVLNKPTKKPTKKCFIIPKEYVGEYSDNDVLAERGSRANEHPGNKNYLRYVRDFAPWYIGKNDDKRSVAANILAIIESEGGRFIREDESNQYCQMEREAIIKKIMQRLRDAKAEQEKEKKKEEAKNVTPLINDDDKGTSNFTAHGKQEIELPLKNTDRDDKPRGMIQDSHFNGGGDACGDVDMEYGGGDAGGEKDEKKEVENVPPLINDEDGGTCNFTAHEEQVIAYDMDATSMCGGNDKSTFDFASEVLDLLKDEPEGQDSHSLDKKKTRMQEAVKNENYILAGELQKEIQSLEQMQQCLSCKFDNKDNDDNDDDLSMKQEATSMCGGNDKSTFDFASEVLDLLKDEPEEQDSHSLDEDTEMNEPMTQFI